MTHLPNKQHLPPERSIRQYKADIDRISNERDNLKARNTFLELKIEQLEKDNFKLKNQMGV